MQTDDETRSLSIKNEIKSIQKKIENYAEQIRNEETRLKTLQAELEKLSAQTPLATRADQSDGLTKTEIERYSRQLIVPNFGTVGQKKLKKSAVLIVGMGGLGCPAAQYLATAGVGRIGIVDYDVVEITNLNRQVLHRENNLSARKVDSAYEAIKEINPHVRVERHCVLLESGNCLDLVRQYDLVLDCTDNLPTRYLLNDACVLSGKPLVSGSALQMDGQLTVYHFGPHCPCYRCIFPVPPPAETVTNCSDGGILGAVTGVIGCLQAIEAVKIVVGLGDTLAGRLLIFDADALVFRNVKLRSRRPDCEICSDQPRLKELTNYERFCGMAPTDKDPGLKLLDAELRIAPTTYSKMQALPHVVLDVRPSAEFDIIALPGAQNWPITKILQDDKDFQAFFAEQLKAESPEFVVVCRRGNDSQIAVQHLKKKFPDVAIRDLVGGLHAWGAQVDQSFPRY